MHPPSMSQLVLSVGSKGLTLTINELSKHPESLLSSLISSMASQSPQNHSEDQYSTSPAEGTDMCSEGSGCKSSWLSDKDDAWHLDLETMDLPIKNDLKVVCLAQAAAILQAAYRHETFPKALWEQLLGRTLESSSADEQLKHDRLLHADVSRIINFFNLPGPVTKWLPPIGSLGIYSGRLLALSYTCHRVQHAQAAVDTMLNYRPHQKPNQPEHVAMFVLIKGDHGGDCTPCKLSVHVLKAVDPRSIEMLRQKNGTSGNMSADGSPCVEPVVLNLMSLKPAVVAHQLTPGLPEDGSSIGADVSWWSLTHSSVIGPSQAVGQELLVSLQKSIQGTGVSFGHGEIKVLEVSNGTSKQVTIPMWLLMW